MATPSYTIVLYSVFSAAGPFPMVLPPPTQGVSWVIRDVCFYWPSSAGWYPVVSQARLLVNGLQVAATPAFATIANTLYETRDIRQSVPPSGTVELDGVAQGWNVQVTGYAFSS